MITKHVRDIFGVREMLQNKAVVMAAQLSKVSNHAPEYIQEKMHKPFLAKGIILEVLPLYNCFKGDSNLPPEICCLQFCLAFKSSSLPSLNIFVNESYHL